LLTLRFVLKFSEVNRQIEQKMRSHLPASLKDSRRDCKHLSLPAAREVISGAI